MRATTKAASNAYDFWLDGAVASRETSQIVYKGTMGLSMALCFGLSDDGPE